jgi:hypothetical protein
LKSRLSFSLLSLAVLLTGCVTAPQTPVALSPLAFSAPTNNYGVVMTDLPVMDTQFPGASCLLCYAAASVANTSLTAHAKTLPYEDLPKLNEQVAAVLRAKGATATVIPKLDLKALPDNSKAAPDFARKDFTSLKAKYKIDKLLVVNISTLAMERSYAAYIPNSDPKAHIAGAAYIVNLSDNKLEWYAPIEVSKASDGKWDEPPKFPGLTNAYYQSLELAKDQVIKPLSVK